MPCTDERLRGYVWLVVSVRCVRGLLCVYGVPFALTRVSRRGVWVSAVLAGAITILTGGGPRVTRGGPRVTGGGPRVTGGGSRVSPPFIRLTESQDLTRTNTHANIHTQDHALLSPDAVSAALNRGPECRYHGLAGMFRFQKPPPHWTVSS